MDRPKKIAVCLHGLGRTGNSMRLVEGRLRAAGYHDVLRPTLPTGLVPMPEVGQRVASLIHRFSERHQGATVDAVTHSAGGLLLRIAAGHGAPLRRAVMLAPPNQGSQKAVKLRKALRLDLLPRDVLREFHPEVVRELPHLGVPLLVIAGGRGKPIGRSWMLDGDDDGTVRVEETRLHDNHHFELVPYGHTLIMFRPKVLDLVQSFLTDEPR